MSEKRSGSSFWIKLLRTVAYLAIICGCMLSLIIGFVMIFGADADHRATGILVGIAIIVLGSVFSLLGSAGIMVFLDMANDLRAIREQTKNGRV